MKKKSTKHLNSIILSAGAVILAVTVLASDSTEEKPGHRHKKDILHLFLEKKMANEGVIPDASGEVKVHENLQSKGKVNLAKVRVEASGLSANSSYSLALNGNVTQTGNTDEEGELKISSELEHPLDILALQSVALMDSAGNVVVSTTLP